MILGINELHRLVKDKELVKNLCQRELNNPEGCGFDLRLGGRVSANNLETQV